MTRKNNKARRLKVKQRREAVREAARVVQDQLRAFVDDRLRLPGVAVHEVTIEPMAFSTPLLCHTNCDTATARDDRWTVVKCWSIDTIDVMIAGTRAGARSMGVPEADLFSNGPYPAGTMSANFHSVLRDNETGVYRDITPDYFLKTRTTRLIVIEPRMTTPDFKRFGFSSFENVVTPAYDALYPAPGTMPDFFEQLEKLDMYKSFERMGRRVIVVKM